MAIQMGTLSAALALEADGFIESLTQAHRRMQKFVNMAQEASSAIIGFGFEIAKVGIETVQSLEEAELSINNMAASTQEATEFLKDLREFAIKTPFQFEDMTTRVRQMQAVGIALEDTIPLMEVFGNQAAAAGDPSRLKFLVKAFTDMRAAGKVMSTDMMQFSNQGIRAWGMLAKELGVTEQVARDMVRNGFVPASKMLKPLLKDIVDTKGGLMKELSKTLMGSWNAFKEGTKLDLADSMRSLVEILKKIIPAFAELTKSVSKFMGKFKPAMEWVLDAAYAALVVFNFLPDSWKNTVYWIAAVSAGLIILATAFLTVVTIVSAFAMAIIAVGAVIGTIGLPLWGAMAFGIMAVVGVIGTFIMLYVLAGEAYAETTKHMSNSLKGFSKFSNTVFSAVGDAFMSFIDIFKFGIKEMLNVLDAPIKALIELRDTVPGIDFLMPNLAGTIDLLEKAVKMKDEAFGDNGDGNFAARWKQFQKDQEASRNAVPDPFVGPEQTLTSKLAVMAGQLNTEILEFVRGPLAHGFSELLPEASRNMFNDWRDGNRISPDPAEEMSFDWDAWIEKMFPTDATGEMSEENKKKLQKLQDDLFDAWFDNMAENWIKALKSANTAIDIAEDMMQELGNELEKIFDNLFDGLEEIAEAQKDSRQQTADFFLGDSGFAEMKEKMGAAMEKAKLLNPAIAGLGLAIAGAIAATIFLITKTKTYEYLQTRVGELFQVLVDSVNELIRPIKPLINVVFNIAEMLIKLFFALNPGLIMVKIIAIMFKKLGAVLYIFQYALELIFSIFSGAGQAFQIVWAALDAAFYVLFQAFKAGGIVMVLFATAIGWVWNAMVNALLLVLNTLAKIPLIGNIFNGIIKDLNESKVNMDDFALALSAVTNLSWEDAKAEANNINATEEATEAIQAMTEELINVPEGFKIALARFNNADIGMSTYTPPSASNPSVPTGGGNTSRTTGGGGTGQIYIENLYIEGTISDIDSLVTEIQAAANKKSFLSTGRVATFVGPKFLAT